MNRNRSFSLGLIILAMFVTALMIAPVSAQGVTFTELTAANMPWDATLSPDGMTVYYTAIGDDGAPAVFSVPAEGGDPVVLAMGSPLALPLGIDVSSDGKTLYIADPWVAGASGNAIFSLPSDGSAEPMPLAGTVGTQPQGVTVMGEDIYFSGTNIETGEPAVFKIPAMGADAPSVVAEGKPLMSPAGLAVADDGTIYVLDRLSPGKGGGSVLRIQNGAVDSIASNVRIGGQMPGIALTMDGSTLLASSLNNEAGTAQVLAVNLGTLEAGVIDINITKNTAAGGLHRAHDVNVFAWSDVQRPGRIYRVDPPANS